MVAMALRYVGALVLIAAGVSFLPPDAATIVTLGGMVALTYTALLWFVAYHVVMYGPEPFTDDDPTTV
jgi:hypothetical protein